MEDLVRALLPFSRYMDVFEEAWSKYKEIKRRERLIVEQKIRENQKRMQRSMDIINSGCIESMANGKIYSSKEAYRADIKAMGYIEVGDQDITAYTNKKKEELKAEQEKKAENDIETLIEKNLARLNK